MSWLFVVLMIFLIAGACGEANNNRRN